MPTRSRPRARHHHNSWFAPAIVAALTFVAFLPTLTNGFVTWDDDRNFLDNPSYRGLAPENLHWMWTTFHMGHYVPLSWMTLGLDYELWGMDARGYHFTGLVLHCINAVLLYFVAARLIRMCASDDERLIRLGAMLAALFFSVHPLRVESVAWVTERRDVLSGLFVSASLLCYLKAKADSRASRENDNAMSSSAEGTVSSSAEGAMSSSAEGGGSAFPYYLSLAFFICALLSKATSLTLPAVLVLLNVYPLRRLDLRAWRSPAARGVYAELLPFAILAVLTVPLTLVALAPPHQLTLAAKVAVSAYSLMFYLWKSVIPTGLSPLYAMPLQVNPAEARFIASYVFVIAVAVAALLARRRYPGFTLATLVFMAVILPMLGIVQNGPQIAADRYTYHASPALTILVAGALLPLLGGARAMLTRSICGVVILTFMALSWRQTTIWHDPERFWTYVLSTDTTSSVAETALGTLNLKENHLDAAIAHYTRALHYDSTYVEGYDNLGVALSRQGKYAQAIPVFERALMLNTRNHETHNNLGVAEANLGRLDAAMGEYQEALELDPTYADAQVNWGNALVRAGRAADAIPHYAEAAQLQPQNADARFNWGVALANAGQLDAAVEQFRAALAIDPNHAEARDYLAKALAMQQGRKP